MRDGDWLIVARGVRGFADGAVSVLLAGYLTRLGFTSFQVGAIVTGTLFGSAALTMFVGLAGQTFRRRHVLLGASILMFGTGVGFAELVDFWPLLIVAIVGTLNPSSGDVSVFLPVEQSALAESVPDRHLTRTFAWYNLSGTLAGALGALASAIPELVARTGRLDIASGERFGFLLYAGVAVLTANVYRRLSPAIEHEGAVETKPLARSRVVVLKLSALFSLDSFGGGFVIQSLLVLWLHQRFALSVQAAGAIFFFAGLLASLSQFLASRLAARIGRIRTMVYTHLPANVFLILAGLAPTAELAVTLLLLRMALSQMDVPARQSYVMAIVPSEERAAAASVTNVPRSLATAASPLLAGMMLDRSSFGWPLIVGGLLKAVYDVVLFVQFRAVTPAGER